MLFQNQSLFWEISKYFQITTVFHSPKTKIRQSVRMILTCMEAVNNEATSEANSLKNMISGYRREKRVVL